METTPDGAVEETGYVFGLAFEESTGTIDLQYCVHAGATYEHIEIENNGLFLTPGLRYRSLSRDVTLAGITSSENLNFVSTEVGVAL